MQSATLNRALAVILYTIGRMSFRRIGKILNVDHTLVYRRIRDLAEQLPEPSVDADITEVELDEMWHFIKDKKINSGYREPLTAVQGKLSHGLQVLVILKQSESSTKNLPI